MKWLKNRRRNKRGLEIRQYVPEMLRYVKAHYVPLVQYSIDSGRKYSLSSFPVEKQEKPAVPAKPAAPAAPEKPAPSGDAPAKTGPSVREREPGKIRYSLSSDAERAVIGDMSKFAAEASKDMAMYDSRALENTYHAWEKENAEYKSFSSEVVRMVKEKYRKTSEFYRAAGIDKRTYHKISTDFGYKPSRKTAFRCCIGLKLNAEEAEELLKLAGMAFSPNDPDDLVLKFCLENGIRDIPGINYMLYRYATRPLSEDEEHVRRHEALMRSAKDREEKAARKR